MSGRRSRDKGSRTERAIAAELVARGIPAHKRSGLYVPGHDIDAIVRGRTLRLEVKSRATGFGTIYSWLADRDVLIVKADRREPLVVLPLALAAQLVSTC
jgi:Holliday junction resolvase